MDNVLQLVGIGRVYGNGIVANRDINIEVRRGEIHAIVGENGAGKSTLMKIIYGMEKPDSGQMFVYGKEVNFSSSMDAIKMNIGMVHQHFMLVNSLTVGENLILNTPKNTIINKRKIAQLTQELCEKYGFNLDGNAVVKNLSVGNQQQLEILKALYRGAQILILDEPTAVLTPQETEKLFEQLKNLKEKGHTILFISHKLNEIVGISDRISILRQGTIVDTFETSTVDVSQLSNLIVGREFSEKIEKPEIERGDVVLRVDGLSYANSPVKKLLDDVSFTVSKGEIVGLCGVEGNGQRELIQAITGAIKNYSGTIELCGDSVKGISRKKLRERGVAHVPEDRIAEGLSKDSSIADNLISTLYINGKFIKHKFFLDRKTIKEFSDEQIAKYEIKANDSNDIVGMLSGGNMQKVVVAREFEDDPVFAVIDQPTRGVDIGASKIIRDKIVELRCNGCAVLLNSADLSELLNISDRVLVFYSGKIVADFENLTEIDEETLGRYMLGLDDMFRDEKDGQE